MNVTIYRISILFILSFCLNAAPADAFGLKMLNFVKGAAAKATGSGGSGKVDGSAIAEKLKGQIINFIVKQGSKGSAKGICKKGKGVSSISIRSAEGAACKVQVVAALAELLCGPTDIEGYNNSQCHKNAVPALQGKDPIQVIRDIRTSKKEPGLDKMCTNAPSDVSAVCAQ